MLHPLGAGVALESAPLSDLSRSGPDLDGPGHVVLEDQHDREQLLRLLGPHGGSFLLVLQIVYYSVDESNCRVFITR